MGCIVTGIHPNNAQSQVFDKNQEWRYSESQANDQWKSLDFEDRSWNSGVAPIGFGESTIATKIRSVGKGEQVPITTYFRTVFQVSQDVGLQGLRFKIRADDGYVAYLNGNELQRWNMPTGLIRNSTLASAAMSIPQELLYHRFEAPPIFLQQGKNVLAFEVHQCNDRSSDLILDLQLFSLERPASQLLQTNSKAFQASLDFNSLHRVEVGKAIPNGFIDGGRKMQIDEFGAADSDREILMVDRVNDRWLQRHLEYARSEELKKLTLVDRATRIARYIDRLMTPADGRSSCENRTEYLEQHFCSQDVLLGDVVDFCGAGVCRHRSLLFKLMADEAEMPCSLVRGNYGTLKKHAGHTWNELVLGDHKIVVVDVMNPQPDFYFPSIGENSLRYYLTVANTLKYPSSSLP